MLLGRERHSLLLAGTEIVEGANTNMNFSLAQKIIAGEKIFLNVSRCRNRPACIAGVLTARPNFRLYVNKLMASNGAFRNANGICQGVPS